MREKFIIDGARFDTIEGFFCEVDEVFTKDLTFRTGHNLMPTTTFCAVDLVDMNGVSRLQSFGKMQPKAAQTSVIQQQQNTVKIN